MSQSKADNIQTLETARLELEQLKKNIGSASDYLDRGQPSLEERTTTEKAIRQYEAEIHTLERRFNALLEEHRRKNPDHLNAWVAIHLDILNDMITETGKLSILSIQHKTYLHMATKTLKAWQEVLANKRNYVTINHTILTDYKDRLSKKLALLT